MVVTVLSIIIAACFFLLCFFILRSNRKLAQLQTLIDLNEKKLEKEFEHQQILQNELKEIKERRTQEQLNDILTGLPGRRTFEDRLSQTINLSKRNQLTFGVIFLDLDGFKVVNDALGHEIGDELLKGIATRLQNSIRTIDTISRFNGDEFVFILPQLSKPEMAALVAQRILDEASQPFNIQGQQLFITASIGVALYPTDGEECGVLLKNANNAMHQAKTRGRNVFQLYQASMHTSSQRELAIASSLQNHEIYRDFIVRYQPLINTQTKKVTCIEALLYWHHPDFGLISLQDILQLAEDNGKIIEIGEWLLTNALHQFLKWRTTDLQPAAIAISVSPRQLENPRFAYRLSQIIQEMNLDPAYVVLEVSELRLPTKLDLIEKMFNMLKHIGVQIALKDFGTGQLSLQYLKRLPFDYLKIASSLVRDITVNKDNEEIVKMIASLGQSLHVYVMAESVETQKQKELLQELGCYIMQGGLFSPPLKPEDLTQELINSFSEK